MPLPFLTGGIKVRIAGAIGAGEFGMVFHYNTGLVVDITDSDASVFAANIQTAWSTHIAPEWTAEVVMNTVVVEGLTSGTDGVGGIAGAVPGTGPGTPVAAQVCVLEKDLIARRYRGGHPRHYWPAPAPVFMSDPTTLSVVGAGALNTAVAAYHSAVVADGVALWGADFFYMSPSYYSGHALRPIPLADPILGFTIESKLATQRRRLVR